MAAVPWKQKNKTNLPLDSIFWLRGSWNSVTRNTSEPSSDHFCSHRSVIKQSITVGRKVAGLFLLESTLNSHTLFCFIWANYDGCAIKLFHKDIIIVKGHRCHTYVIIKSIVAHIMQYLYRYTFHSHLLMVLTINSRGYLKPPPPTCNHLRRPTSSLCSPLPPRRAELEKHGYKMEMS